MQINAKDTKKKKWISANSLWAQKSTETVAEKIYCI